MANSTAAKAFVLLAVLSFVPYLRAIEFSFVADDDVYLGVRNNFLLELSLQDIWRLLVVRTNPWEYLPVRDLTYWFDAKVFGVFPDGYHAMNLAWYSLILLLLFFVFRLSLQLNKAAWSAPKIQVLSCLGVLLFASHPAHVEPVVWISGRKDLLAGFFVFAAWGAVLWSARQAWSIRGGCAALLFALLACFSKSTAIAGVCVLAFFVSVTLLDQRRRGLGAGVIRGGLLSAGLLLLALGAMLLHGRVAVSTGVAIVNDPGFVDRLERASRILAASAEIVFLPVDLRIFHDVYALGHWHWAVSLGLVGVLIVVSWRLLRGQGAVLEWGLVWLVLPLLPYLQLQPFSTWSMASERFVYQASFGWALLILGLLNGCRPRVLLLLAGSWLVIVSPISYKRVGDWGLESAMFLKEASMNPGYFNAARYAVDLLVGRGEIEQATLAINNIQRADAREILRAASTHQMLSRQLESAVTDPEERRGRYCASLRALDERLGKEFAKIPQEKDLTFNNFLRNIVTGVYPGRKMPRICTAVALQ